MAENRKQLARRSVEERELREKRIEAERDYPRLAEILRRTIARAGKSKGRVPATALRKKPDLSVTARELAAFREIRDVDLRVQRQLVRAVLGKERADALVDAAARREIAAHRRMLHER